MNRSVLTLILPGEVKVDLAAFDVKFQTMFLYTVSDFLKSTYSFKNIFQIFFNFLLDIKK
jgi:hypothetical protein